jgi:uncharacterized membrane protein YphA (DoxX/SURF4 family)
MQRVTHIDWGLLILRAGYAALLFVLHGHARLIRAYHYAAHGQSWTFVPVVAKLGFPRPGLFAVMSAVSESIGATLVGLGIYMRVSAAIIAVNMTVALYSEARKGDPYELPALYLLGAVSLVILGSGDIAFDRFWHRQR